jgi:hypothetical protein
MPGEYTVIVEVVNEFTDYGHIYGNCYYGEGPYKGDLQNPDVDFVGVPIRGKSPLAVQFTLSATAPGSRTKLLYVKVYDWSTEGGLDVSVTDTCFRLAVPQRLSQGIGWSQYDGMVNGLDLGGWPYPEGVVGACELMTANEERVELIMDSRTCKIFQLGILDRWKDKYRGEYDEGVEIESDVQFPEIAPSIQGTARLRFDEAELFVKPWLKDRRSTGEYNAAGFRGATEIDFYLRKDSMPQDAAITVKSPLNGQLVVDQKIESSFVQPGTRIRGAPWRLARAQCWFEEIDEGGTPAQKARTEREYQLEFEVPLLWLPRSDQVLLDYSSVALAAGSYASVTQGPDGKAGSAVVMGPGDYVGSAGIGSLTGDFAFVAWVKQTTSNIQLFSMPTGAFQIRLSGKTLIVSDAAHSATWELPFSGGAWELVAVVRSGSSWVVTAYGGQHVGTKALSSVLTYGGTATLFNGACTWYDARVLPKAVSADAIGYISNDVVAHNGAATGAAF